MSARITYPLKLGALELQLSPFRPTQEETRRSVQIAECTRRTEKADLVKDLTDWSVIADFITELLLRSARQNHPGLTRDRIEKELNFQNLPDAVNAIRGTSLRYAQLALESRIH